MDGQQNVKKNITNIGVSSLRKAVAPPHGPN